MVQTYHCIDDTDLNLIYFIVLKCFKGKIIAASVYVFLNQFATHDILPLT